MRYHGKKGVVYISTTGTGTAVSVVALSSWALHNPTDKVEVTRLGDTNKRYIPKIPDMYGELSGWWDHTSDQLYDASRSADGVKMYLYPSSDVPGSYWHGPAWVDFAIEAGSDAAVAVSADFVANGLWSASVSPTAPPPTPPIVFQSSGSLTWSGLVPFAFIPGIKVIPIPAGSLRLTGHALTIPGSGAKASTTQLASTSMLCS